MCANYKIICILAKCMHLLNRPYGFTLLVGGMICSHHKYQYLGSPTVLKYKNGCKIARFIYHLSPAIDNVVTF